MNQITRVLLALLVFTLPFDQAFALPFVGSLSRAAGLLVAFAGLLALLSTTTIRLRKVSLFLVVAGLFVTWNAISVLWSIDRVGTVTQVFTFVQLWVLVWLLWQFFFIPGDSTWLHRAYMAGTWFTIATIAWNYFSANPTVDAGRFSAFGTDANYTAQSILLAIPMAFDSAVNGRPFSRITSILLIPASIFAILLTGSRGGGLIAAVTIVGSVVLILRYRPAIKVLVLAGIAALVVGIAVFLPDRTIGRFMTTLSQVESADFSGRGNIWRAGAETWLSYPALGAGAGSFETAVVSTLGRARASHNSFLGLLVELGPIGPLLFLGLFVIAALPHLRTLSLGVGETTAESRRFAALHVVLLAALFLTQMPTNWQYVRVTWFILAAATLDGALLVRARKTAPIEVAPRGA